MDWMGIEIDFWFRAGLVFLTAGLVTIIGIPTILSVARLTKLYDRTGDRKSHSAAIPRLGGIAIFASFSIASLLWVGADANSDLRFLVLALIILFLAGIKDDVLVISPFKKFLSELCAASIFVLFTDIRLSHMHGLFGIGEISEFAGILLSILLILIIINGFNLIDGIDGLASMLGMIAALFYTAWFWFAGEPSYALIAFVLFSSLLAFIPYNIRNGGKKIFMGDSGSLIIGMVIAMLTIQFNEMNILSGGQNWWNTNSAPAVSFAVIIAPLFDLLRVFFERMFSGYSPFRADRRHIHHRLLDLGTTHLKATITIASVNLLFIFMVCFLRDIGILWLMLLNLSLALSLSLLPTFLLKRKGQKE